MANEFHVYYNLHTNMYVQHMYQKGHTYYVNKYIFLQQNDKNSYHNL